DLFTLCSAGRDTRDARFHAGALDAHLGFYARLAQEQLGPAFELRIALTDLASAEPRAAWRRQIPGPGAVFRQSPGAGRRYYLDVCSKIHARNAAAEWLELGDGGGVDWAGKLLSNAKERLFISGISSERICALSAAAR